MFKSRDFVSSEDSQLTTEMLHESVVFEPSLLGEPPSAALDEISIPGIEDVRGQESNASESACSSDEQTSIGFIFNQAQYPHSDESSQTRDLLARGEWFSYDSVGSDEVGLVSSELLDTISADPNNAKDLDIDAQSFTFEPFDLRSIHWSHEPGLTEDSLGDFTFLRTLDDTFDLNERESTSLQLQSPSHNSAMSVRLEGSEEDIRSSLGPRLIDMQSELVGIYFSIVCPIISTFDSEQNTFRTFVSEKWQNSLLMVHTIQSMALAKMIWLFPDMKAQALEYHSRAFSTLHSDIVKASGWNAELLFIVLLLGISSSWFDITDLGTVHLAAVQHAILNNTVDFSDSSLTLSFFTDALIYWEMVSCVVDDNVASHNYSQVEYHQTQSLGPSRKLSSMGVPRIKPHPWTGVASEPQALFTRLAQQIRGLRSFTPGYGSSLRDPEEFLNSIKALDEALWSCRLPGLHDISSIGDENTPAIHHLLLAEAYMFANLYQLYSIFPSVRRSRVKWIVATVDLNHFNQASWAECQIPTWQSVLQRDYGVEEWIKFLGRSIITRLEQIQTCSGTSCVQALLLLVAATSLSVASGSIETDEERWIRDSRRFVLDRLGFLSKANLSTPISYVKTVVLEIFRRLDAGVDVFWMDVLQSMGTATIIG